MYTLRVVGRGYTPTRDYHNVTRHEMDGNDLVIYTNEYGIETKTVISWSCFNWFNVVT